MAELKSPREILDKREEHTISADELLKMTDFVQKKNYFQFKGQLKQQVSSTTIGTSFVPPYPCLLKFEIAFYEKKHGD